MPPTSVLFTNGDNVSFATTGGVVALGIMVVSFEENPGLVPFTSVSFTSGDRVTFEATGAVWFGPIVSFPA